MNPIAIAKFFNIICDAIFMSLCGASQMAGGFFGLILNYFATVKTNSHGMLHLYCLMWLKGVSHLATLQSLIQSNVKFRQPFLLFLEYIIKYSASKNPYTQTLYRIDPDANNIITTS